MKDDNLNTAEELLDKIGDSLDDLDFEGLSNSIRESVEYIRREAEKGYRDLIMTPSKEQIKYSKYYETPYERYKVAERRRQEERAKRAAEKETRVKRPVPLFKGIPGKILGPVETGLGISGLIVFGGLSLVFGIPSLIGALMGGTVSAAAAGILGVSLPFTALSGGLFGHGSFLKNRAERFTNYQKECQGKDYIMINDLVEKTGYQDKQIKKDVHFLLDRGIVPQMTMDERETCLLFTDEARKQYNDAEQARIKRELEELKKREEQKELERKKQEGSKAEREWIYFSEEMNAFFEDLKVKKGEIDNPKLLRDMDEVEVLLRQIYECIEEHPEMISGTGHLVSYYLPCMIKLLTTYEDLEEQPIQGDNILKTKQEIEDSFDTIISALTNMYDELFRNVSMDISSDIQVMNAMLAQDGWNDDLHNR